MAKLTLNEITSGYASVALLNNNFTAIETALENTLSRDGEIPNQMLADIDMNSNDLLNVGSIDTQSLSVGGSDFSAAITSAQDAAVTAGIAAQAAIDAASVISGASCCLDSLTSFFDFGLITDSSPLFPTDFGSVV